MTDSDRKLLKAIRRRRELAKHWVIVDGLPIPVTPAEKARLRKLSTVYGMPIHKLVENYDRT